jgi:hypothetical protein
MNFSTNTRCLSKGTAQISRSRVDLDSGDPPPRVMKPLGNQPPPVAFGTLVEIQPAGSIAYG